MAQLEFLGILFCLSVLEVSISASDSEKSNAEGRGLMASSDYDRVPAPSNSYVTHVSYSQPFRNKVTVYKEPNFTGQKLELDKLRNIGDCQDLFGGSSELNSFNDAVQSIKLESGVCIDILSGGCSFIHRDRRSPKKKRPSSSSCKSYSTTHYLIHSKANAGSNFLTDLCKTTLANQISAIKLIDCSTVGSSSNIQNFNGGNVEKIQTRNRPSQSLSSSPPSSSWLGNNADQIQLKSASDCGEFLFKSNRAEANTGVRKLISALKCVKMTPEIINQTDTIFQFEILGKDPDSSDLFFMDFQNPPGQIRSGLIQEFHIAITLQAFDFVYLFLQKTVSFSWKNLQIKGKMVKLLELKQVIVWLNSQFPGKGLEDAKQFC